MRLGNRSAMVAWLVCSVAIAMVLAAAVITILDPNSSAPANPNLTGPKPGDQVAPGQVLFGLLTVIVCSALALAGAVAVSRRPRNAVGWLLLSAGLSLSLTMLTDTLYWHLAFGRETAPEGAKWFAWVEAWSWVPAVVCLFGLLPFLFPTGATPSPRWRPAAWVTGGAGVVVLVTSAFRPGSLESIKWVDNPIGVEGFGLEAIGIVAFVVFLVGALAGVVSLVVRYRRSHGIERQQLRWVVAAGCLLLLSFLVSGILTSAWNEQAGWVAMLIGLLALVAAIAVALLRYRLYDIDVVINRTLVYGALTAILAAAYLASVLLLQLLLSGITKDSGLAVAASTLAVAALFRPARSRIQATVDRRFYRRKYDAARTLERFGTRLRDELDLDALGSELRAVVADTMQPASVSLWLRVPETR
jgi:hypothetical protein